MNGQALKATNKLLPQKSRGLVPNRNSFFNNTNAVLQTGRNLEFSKVESSASLIDKAQLYLQEH